MNVVRNQYHVDAENYLREIGIAPDGKYFAASHVMNAKRRTEECAVCDGTLGDIEKYNCHGYESVLVDDGRSITTVSRKCEHKSAVEKQITIDELIGEMPRELRYCSLKNFSLEGVSQGVLLAAERTREAMENGNSLVLAGGKDGIGVGKTHLAAAVVVDALIAGKSALFVSVPELMNRLRSYGSNGDHDKVLAEVCRCDVLALDDLGAERYTGWVAEQMYLMVNQRYVGKLQTIVTTNFATPSDLTDHMGEVVGMRIVSRLYEMGPWVHVVGGDYRVRKREMEERGYRQHDLGFTGTDGPQ